MNDIPVEVAVPVGSIAETLVPGTSFCDSWAVCAVDASLSALGQFLRAVGQTPAWIEASMAARNSVGRWFGIRPLGALGAVDRSKTDDHYLPGDRVGIFTLLYVRFDEALLGIDDSHLDVRLSVHRATLANGRVVVTVTTAVKVHNLLGRLYMVPVKPMHRIIAPRVLRAVASEPDAVE